MITSVGFTGTRKGMTPWQLEGVKVFLVRAISDGAKDFHHGCAVGADTEAAALAKRLGFNIVEHPATGDPLGRNRKIVAASERMVAAPGEAKELLRSGTWATVRYSRKAGVPLSVVLPDGTLA
jgi:imidazolonepropionase-like amidohydrolase